MSTAMPVLLIEDDSITCQKFISCTNSDRDLSIVSITASSDKAIELTQQYLPAAIILDLELNNGKGSGIDFLQAMQTLSLPFKPFILITTNNCSNTILEYTRKLGADFIMYKHQTDYSEQKAINFLKSMKDVINSNRLSPSSNSSLLDTPNSYNMQLTQRISLELDRVGINPKHKGYTYLIDAIIYAMDNNTISINSVLGKKYGTTNTSIERAMQNALCKAWRNYDIDELLKHYTAKIDPERGMPTVTEFVCYYASKIKSSL